MKCSWPAGDVLPESYSIWTSWPRSARGKIDALFSSRVKCATFRVDLQSKWKFRLVLCTFEMKVDRKYLTETYITYIQPSKHSGDILEIMVNPRTEVTSFLENSRRFPLCFLEQLR